MFKIWFERTLPAEFEPLLAGLAMTVGAASETPDDPFAALSQAEAIIAGGRLRYDATVMDQAPRLRVIARTGIGLDNVAVAEATARGIAVCNAPDAPTLSTAGKLIIIVGMFVGRLGPLVVALAILRPRQGPSYSYPQEQLAIG